MARNVLNYAGRTVAGSPNRTATCGMGLAAVGWGFAAVAAGVGNPTSGFYNAAYILMLAGFLVGVTATVCGPRQERALALVAVQGLVSVVVALLPGAVQGPG